MAGLLDLFGGGSDPGGLYGDSLTPEQKQAVAQRGLLGFLGGMQKSGALDYTAPFLSGKVPAGFAAGLAGGAGGMGEAQDAAGLNALRGGLLGLQGQQLKSQLTMRDRFLAALPGLLGGETPAASALPTTAGPATSAPRSAGGGMMANPALTGSWLDNPVTQPPFQPGSDLAAANPDAAPAAERLRQQIVAGVAGAPQTAPVSAAPPGGLLAAPGTAGAAPSPNLTNGIDPRTLAAAGVMAQLSGIGDAFKPIESYYYNSPGYKGSIAEVEAGGKARGELPYVGPRAQAERSVTEPSDKRLKEFQAGLDVGTKRQEQIGAATLDMTTIPVTGPDGKVRETTATRAQAVRAAQGLGVPELGIPALRTEPGSTPGDPAAQRGGVTLGKPVARPGEETLVKAGIEAMNDAYAAELAANKRTQSYGQMAEAMKGFVPGATAELKLGANRILKDVFGINGDSVPPAEVFQQAARHIQATAQPKGQGSVSNYERELFAQAVPRMVNSPESLAKAIDIARRLDDYDRQVAQIHRDAARDNQGLPDYVAAQQRIAAVGPPLSPGELNALDALRGGGAPAKSAAQPPAAAAPTATGPNGQRLILQNGQWQPLR